MDGRTRWIHCTPLTGGNGSIGVWMVVIVDDEEESAPRPRRTAPPVDPNRQAERRRKGMVFDDTISVNSSFGPLHEEPEMRRLAQDIIGGEKDRNLPGFLSILNTSFLNTSESGQVTPPDSPWTLRIGD